ncbi:hypothetical protein N7497_000920 [Penicillium chrysogenum]|nr:hypothetical protein N7497_000920 [Penicillium chrysogenum]
MNQALDFVNPEQGHIAIRHQPRCRNCGKLTELRYGKPWNESGNEGRPYYICLCVPQKKVLMLCRHARRIDGKSYVLLRPRDAVQ